MHGFDYLWPGGPRFKQTEGAFKLSTDSVLLAHFANTSRSRRIIDLGCGAGILGILIAFKSEKAEIVCMDILPEAASASSVNISANRLEGRVRVIEGDLREYRRLFPAEGFDHVVSNPPYFPVLSGKNAPDALRATARDERSCTLSDLCAAAAYLCRWGGLFSLVHRPERLSEVFLAMAAAGIEPKRLRMVGHKAESAPSLVLIEGKRGGKPGLAIEPTLILANADGTDSREVLKIYHREGTT